MFAARLLGCEGDGNAGVWSGGAVVAVSTYMDRSRGSCVLSSACDVIEMNVVRGVGGVCDMCLARGGVLMAGPGICILFLRILVAPSVHFCCTLSISAS